MPTRSLQGRLLLTFVTLMALGLGSVIVLSGLRLNAQTLDRNEHDLELQAQLIANALRDPIEHGGESDRSGGRSLDALITSYAQGVGGRVTLVDAQLNVVLSSDSLAPTRVPENASELVAARNGIFLPAIRTDASQRVERLFVAVPVVGEHGQAINFVQLSIPMEPILIEMRETWLSFLAIGLAVLVGTVIASVVIARQIAVPVQKLTTTSEQIAAGRLDERVSPAGPSEIRRLGVAFNRMTERVQEMISQQRAFVDNAAHELRSPLTSIRLRIEMLQTRGRDNPDLAQRYLGQMEREVGYLQRMVDHLLTLAAVESREQPAPKTPVDLAPVLYDVADGMSDMVQQAGLTMQTDIPEHLPPVQANPDQMSILVRNLIDNSIKYSPRGGSVSLTARSSPDAVEIQVTDTGMGIPAEALSRIFDRFYRADTSHSRVQGGAGLGLSLVRAIAEAHGGHIDVQSRVNEGSTFTVFLPRYSN